MKETRNMQKPTMVFWDCGSDDARPAIRRVTDVLNGDPRWHFTWDVGMIVTFYHLLSEVPWEQRGTVWRSMQLETDTGGSISMNRSADEGFTYLHSILRFNMMPWSFAAIAWSGIAALWPDVEFFGDVSPLYSEVDLVRRVFPQSLIIRTPPGDPEKGFLDLTVEELGEIADGDTVGRMTELVTTRGSGR